jgi:hypothetical protein
MRNSFTMDATAVFDLDDVRMVLRTGAPSSTVLEEDSQHSLDAVGILQIQTLFERLS